MRIKKRKHNHYLLSDANVWVRNFCEPGRPYDDINKLYSNTESKMLFNNELQNLKIKRGAFEPDRVHCSDMVIVSDGYNFKKLQFELAKLPNKVKIIAVNGALAKWRMIRENGVVERVISYYVVNNPYIECAQFLPTEYAYYPNCIASIRTNPKFVQKYKGSVLFYQPSPIKHFSGAMPKLRPYLDDCRNPIGAAISLAFLFGVRRLLLFCCDSSFEDRRAAAVKLDNDLWSYPQQIASQQIVDGFLYWLKEKGIKIGYYGNGIKYSHAEYIELDKLAEFFTEENNG